LIKENRVQYFAEAHAMYKEHGENWWRQFNERDWETAQQFQSDRRPIDPWEHEIATWLRTTDAAGERNADKTITTNLILRECLRMPVDRMNRSDQMRIGSILRTLGGKRRRMRGVDGRGFCYEFGTESESD
jgi:hypothetical protein